MIKWWPTIVVVIWLDFVSNVAGALAAMLCAISALAVCVLAMWEAGARKDEG